MTLPRCNARASDPYWPDHRCGLPKGHENLPRDDPNRSLQHKCYAVYRRKRIKRRTEAVTKPCGFSWEAR